MWNKKYKISARYGFFNAADKQINGYWSSDCKGIGFVSDRNISTVRGADNSGSGELRILPQAEYDALLKEIRELAGKDIDGIKHDVFKSDAPILFEKLKLEELNLEELPKQ